MDGRDTPEAPCAAFLFLVLVGSIMSAAAVQASRGSAIIKSKIDMQQDRRHLVVRWQLHLPFATAARQLVAKGVRAPADQGSCEFPANDQYSTHSSSAVITRWYDGCHSQLPSRRVPLQVGVGLRMGLRWNCRFQSHAAPRVMAASALWASGIGSRPSEFKGMQVTAGLSGFQQFRLYVLSS